MKATLTFTLPEEREEFTNAIEGTKYIGALQELDNWLRGLHKYSEQDTVSIENIRAKIIELAGDIWD